MTSIWEDLRRTWACELVSASSEEDSASVWTVFLRIEIGKKLEASWTVHVPFTMGCFLACHKIPTVTTAASPAAFWLSGSKGATSSLGRDSMHIPRSYGFRSALEPCGTVHREQHFCDSFIISPSSPPCKPAKWSTLGTLQVCQTDEFGPGCLGLPCSPSLCQPQCRPRLQGWFEMSPQ